MKVKRLLAIGGLFCALACCGVAAQTINQPIETSSTTANNFGQSFRATLTGEVVAISVAPKLSKNANLYIYNGTAGSGTLNTVGSPIYTQPITLTATPLGVMQHINLTTPLPVTSGSSYTFILSGAQNLGTTNINSYANGTAIASFSVPLPTFDLAFAVFEQLIAPAAPATPASIPSSSTWSLMGAGALIMAAALFQRHRSGRQSRQ